MNNALIGFSGFVGTTLQKQANFSHLYRSTNMDDIDNRTFDMVVCAGAPAQKWIANKDPQGDREKIEGLIEHLKTIKCEKFILISTVDVFHNSVGADEETPVDEIGLHPYGLHRRWLEKFVASHFSNYLIVRLPGLVGPGLRKNIIFDFLNENNVSAIDSRGVFQFYPMVNLWADIEIGLMEKIKILHLTAEPLSVQQVAISGFGRSFDNVLQNDPATYDFRTRHAPLFGASGSYQYSAREEILAIRAYAQSEPAATSNASGGAT